MAGEGDHASRRWLSRLHVLDRAAALRWIREVGELRFLRIATAAKGARERGRPPAAYPKSVRLALFLWVTKQTSYDDAAGTAARQAFAARDWEGGGPVTLDYLQRRIRKGMKDAPALLVDAIAEEAMAEGRETIMPSRAIDRSSLGRFSGRTHTFRDTSGIASRRAPPQTGIDLGHVKRTVKLAAFMRAFEDLIPENTPISQLAALFDQTHQALRELSKPET